MQNIPTTTLQIVFREAKPSPNPVFKINMIRKAIKRTLIWLRR